MTKRVTDKFQDESLIPFYRRRLFWTLFGGPSAATIFYFVAVATPRYESQTILRVYESGQNASAASAGGLASLAGGSSASPGAYVFTDYVSSWNAFNLLNPDYLEKNWKAGDFLTRFGGIQSRFSNNRMRLWDYYRGHVTTKINTDSGHITLVVEGYSADFVHNLSLKIVEMARSELAQSGLKASEAERQMLLDRLDKDKRRLAEDLGHIQELQKTAGITDLKTDYAEVMANLSNSEKEKFSIETKAAASEYLAQRNQQIATLKTELTAIDAEIASQRKKVQEKSKVYEKFNRIEQAVAEDTQVILLDDAGLLESEQNAVRHAYYIDIIEPSVAPTDPTKPNALFWGSLVISLLFVAYAVLK